MDDNGLCIIRCDPPVNGSDSFVFTPDVAASWKALLGLASTREAIAAIMQGREDTSAGIGFGGFRHQCEHARR